MCCLPSHGLCPPRVFGHGCVLALLVRVSILPGRPGALVQTGGAPVPEPARLRPPQAVPALRAQVHQPARPHPSTPAGYDSPYLTALPPHPAVNQAYFTITPHQLVFILFNSITSEKFICTAVFMNFCVINSCS